MGTLTPNEKMMRLQGYVRVTNNSGEDYENAQDAIDCGQGTSLSTRSPSWPRRQYPYERPGIVS